MGQQSNANTLALVNLLLGLGGQVTVIGATLAKAATENRDVTNEELAAASAAAQTAIDTAASA